MAAIDNSVSIFDVKDFTKPILEQFVSDVVDFSSQYGSDSSISYTASNLVGKPNVFPKYGDYTQTFLVREYGIWWVCAPSASRGFNSPLPLGTHVRSQDFVEFKFEKPIYPLQMDLFETYNPGSVVRILAYNPETCRWKVLWSGPPQNVSSESRIFSPPLKKMMFSTQLFRLEFYHKHLKYYSELDAILVLGVHNDNDLTIVNGEQHAISKKMRRLHIGEGNHNRETSSNSNFYLLPNEVLHLIISYLDLESLCTAAKVSRLFHKLCYDPILYNELDLQPYWTKVTVSTLNGLQKRCSSIQRLNLSWCGGQKRLNSNCFCQFLENCAKQLTCLRLSNCSFITNESLKAIADFCPSLSELHLQSCRQKELSQLGFMQISRMTELIHLDLYHTRIDRHSIVTILRSCLKLEHLCLGGCSAVNNYDEVAFEIGRNLKHIKSIDLWRAKSLTSLGVGTIAEYCRDLREFDIGWCLEVYATSGCLRELAHKCCKLKKIFLTALRTVSDADLISIATHCKDLEQFDILGTREISSDAVFRVLSQCKKLKFLDISFCGKLNESTIQNWREMFPSIEIMRSYQSPD